MLTINHPKYKIFNHHNRMAYRILRSNFRLKMLQKTKIAKKQKSIKINSQKNNNLYQIHKITNRQIHI